MTGLVYSQRNFREYIEVFFDGDIKEVHVKHLKLLVKSEDLYPSGYNMDQLFVSYKERKFDHDMKRGSKKALKKLKKYGIEEMIK
jgi:hypothetical protein